jgi:hypothetical protein
MSAELLIKLEIFHLKKIVICLNIAKEFLPLPSQQQKKSFEKFIFQKKIQHFLKPPRLFL